MIVIKRKDVIFTLIVITFLIASVSIAVISSLNKNYKETSASCNSKVTFVIDAGHGEPDGGAVASDGTKESILNLEIARKLETLLLNEGFDVIMTRTDENNIAGGDSTLSIKQIKARDLSKRVEIANGDNVDYMISIHMNKFSDARSKGWQVFYAKNSEKGKTLAEAVQKCIGESVQKENKRTALTINGIKIIDKSKVPAIIVECGFLSNNEELELLKNCEYQEKIAIGIVNGVKEFLSTEARF